MDFADIKLTELSDDDLASLASDLTDLYTEMTSAEEFSAEDDESVEIIDAIDAVRVEFEARTAVAAKAEKAGKVAEFAKGGLAKWLADKKKNKDDEEDAKDGGKDEASEMAAEPVEPEAKPEVEAVSAAATPKVKLSPAGLASSEPAPDTKAISTVTASADVPGYNPGSPLNDALAVAKAFVAKRRTIYGTDAGNDGNRYVVASVAGNYPPERTLGNDVVSNMAKIEAVTSPQALVASGGICAIPTPYYDLQVLGSAERPVKAAMAQFAAERGGIRFMPPPRLTDLDGSNLLVTAAQDAIGYGVTAPLNGSVFKPSLRVTCAADVEVEIAALTRSLTFGNFGARTYPEQVAAWISLSLTHWARFAETYLLDQIKATCTAVTAAAYTGAVRTLLPEVDVAITAYKSRHRIGPSQKLRFMAPYWMLSLLRTDMARQLYVPEFEVTDAQIEGWLRVRGVEPSWYLDGATGSGQVFGNQGAGALLAYPGTVQWYLWVEGSLLFLDGGTLDLGIVRDSTLNKTNDYQIFFESFENIANVGVESLCITSTVNPTGQGPAPV